MNKYIEFFGSSLTYLTVADRSSIAHLCVEQGALLAYFPWDDSCLKHFSRTGKRRRSLVRSPEHVCVGRDESLIAQMRHYLIAAKLFSDDLQHEKIVYSNVYEFDMCTVAPYCSGPKRPQDKVSLCSMKDDFQQCLVAPNGFKVRCRTPLVLSSIVLSFH